MPWVALSRWMAVIMMAAVLYVVGAADPLDQHPVEAAQSTCAAPVALRNGDFESPLIADGSVAAVPPPGWKGPVTLRRDGTQHAELTAGTLYQDVTTVPGQTLHWELRHRGGALAVLIGSPTGTLERQGDELTGTTARWATYAGAYTVPEDQTRTRFALRAAAPGSVDAVSFGTPACLVTTTAVSEQKSQVKGLLSYAVTARNAGGNPARRTEIIAGVPDGVTPVDAPRARTLRADAGVLEPGASHTLTYQVRIDPEAAGTTIEATATAAYATSLAGVGERLVSTSNEAGTWVEPAADLTVDLTGDPTEFTVTTGNEGPSDADEVRVTADLPDGLTAVSATSPQGTCALTSDAVECDYRTLPAGETRELTVTAVGTPGAVSVTATSATAELTPTDNTVNRKTGSAPPRDPAPRPAAVTLTTTTPTVVRDDTAHFRATVPASPSATTVRFTPGEGLAVTAATPDRGIYRNGEWTVPAGAAAHLDLTAIALTAGPLSLTASSGGAPDTVTVTASPGNASLSVAVVAPRDPRPADVGDTVRFRYRVTNDGNEPMDSVTVTDTLLGPATCPATTLAPGATMTCEAAPYEVTRADVDAGTPLTTIVSAEAYPSGAAEPSLFGPTTAEAPIVTARPALTVTSTATLSPRSADTIHYSYVVHNIGNQTMRAVHVTGSAAGRATCAATTLAPGESTTCTPAPHRMPPAGDFPTDRAYAYGTAPDATAATAYGPFLTTTPDPALPTAPQSPATTTPPAQGTGQTAPPAQGSGHTVPPAQAAGQAVPPAQAAGQNPPPDQLAPPLSATAGRDAAQETRSRETAGPQPRSAARAPAPLATTAVPARGAAPQVSKPSTPDPSVPNPTPTVITPPPATVPPRTQAWADAVPEPVPFSGSPLATLSVLGLALIIGGLIVLGSYRGRWWPRRR
ncbi:DUF11 domain-containing protein [Paractinoplanes deccanensis]|uniref:DUF11 domain-containing protein n=1 Tax=Paractinoplanes deccanensis TaxID=113561 RepID=UPI001942B020|nr:DUF11 domain-containing protein [Actinoplanes deccanensis]